MNTFYFLRHGKTKVDKNTPISTWVLSDAGQAQAAAVSKKPEFLDVDLIIASGEEKAYQTAKPLADFLGKEIIRHEALNELDRDRGGFMDAETYEHAVEQALLHRDTSFSNWETANHALERFSAKIDEIERINENKKILIVGHGFTINLYFAKLLDQLDRIYERIQRNDFCDWGTVEAGRVVRDLGK